MVTQLFLSYLKEIERDPQTDNTIEDFMCDTYAAKSQIIFFYFLVFL